jgi:hypothetical protein
MTTSNTLVVQILDSSSEAAEDCTKVVDFCKDELGVDVKKDEIDRAHRVGRPNGNKRGFGGQVVSALAFHL